MPHRQVDERLHAVANASTDAIVAADASGGVIFWNDAAERIFGWSAEEMRGRRLERIMPERYRAAHEAGLVRLAVTGESRLIGQTILIEGRRRDGTEFPVQLSLGRWDDEHGIGFTAVIRDVTELENRNRELERSNAELEQFAYVASHDLAEPLRSITGYLHLLERRAGEQLDAESRSYVAAAIDGATRMRSLIGDLLAYSRVGQGARDPVPVDLGSVTADVADTLLVGREDARVEIGALPTVTGEPHELRQLMQNLIGNALKFVPAERTPLVEVTAEREHQGWRISVADNGIGIDPDQASMLFGVFQRAHGAQEFEGTGVGLAIARKVVEHHGGRIWWEPRAAGGTRFSFTIPD